MTDLFDLVVQGDVVTPQGVLHGGQVAVSAGRIAALAGAEPPLPARRRVDARGRWVLPGAIDAHVHCLSVVAEGFVHSGEAAAAGGITTIIDMPYDSPSGCTSAEALAAKIDRVRREAVVDMALLATIKKVGGIDQIAPMADLGAVGFKLSLFESDPQRFPRIPDFELVPALAEIARTGLRVGVHAENGEIIDHMIGEYRAAGREYPLAHAETRPWVSETEAILKALEFAHYTGAAMHIFHVSLARGIELVDWYRQQGDPCSAETCIHYLVFDQSALERLGARVKINPPLRPAADVAGLWEQLAAGKIDIVTSDHAPWPGEKKASPGIFGNASGAPGLETLLPLLYSEGVARGRIGIERLAYALAEGPARLFRLFPRKGQIAVGADADLVILDPHGSWRIDEAKLRSTARWSPYHGMELQGRITATFVRGRPVYDGENVHATPGDGVYIPAFP